MREGPERWPSWTAAGVAGLVPALAMFVLARLPVPGFDARSGDAAVASIDVVFLRRAGAPATESRPVDAATRGRARARTAPSTRPHVDADAIGAVDDATARRVAIAPAVSRRRLDLDLSVREPPTTGRVQHEPRAWMERDRVMDPRTTRFERAWVPAGNAIEQARFRSPAVNAALGLFGGAPRRCTEVERRLRVRDCLPLDADEGDTEALRRSID